MRLLALVAMTLLASPALANCPDELIVLKLDKTPPEYPHVDRIIADCSAQIEHPGAISMAHDQQIALINRASFQVLKHAYKEALGDLETASRLRPEGPESKQEEMTRASYLDYAMGVVLARLGKNLEANHAFENAYEEAQVGNLLTMQEFVRTGMKAELGEEPQGD